MAAIELLIAAEAALGAMNVAPLRSLRVVSPVTPRVLGTFMDGGFATWVPEDAKGSECQEPKSMLGKALRWLKADCDGEISIHEKLIAKNACMFGAAGANEVLTFKKNFLTAEKNYEVDAILDVDLPNRVVVASFECLIPGKEGRGTDVMQFNEELQVTGVQAIRHSQVKS
eukprot:symbB.v1.2.040684.t1/scaffold7439.1/size11247/1